MPRVVRYGAGPSPAAPPYVATLVVPTKARNPTAASEVTERPSVVVIQRDAQQPFSPMQHWTEHNIRVHTFTCVLALQIAHLMRHRTRRARLHLSVPALLGELAGIAETVLLYQGDRGRPKARRMLTETNPTQDTLTQLFHLDWSIPGLMHTSFRVTGVLSGVESSVVLGLGFCGWDSAKAVHKPALVVPAHPRGGHVLQVGEGVDRPAAKRGTLADTLGLIQPYSRLAQGIIERVADSPHRWN